MMADYAGGIRRATLEASRLHRDLAIQAKVARGSGRVDVYGTIAKLGVPLLFTQLDGLLGAYYREPSPGVLVTTRRPLSQQRFTAAHELGHHWLGHAPSLDDESILRRAPFEARSGDNPQEVEAEAFAAAFLLPRWLLIGTAHGKAGPTPTCVTRRSLISWRCGWARASRRRCGPSIVTRCSTAVSRRPWPTLS
jgi:Zn-dependent peptidase ImmA (M78 family)